MSDKIALIVRMQARIGADLSERLRHVYRMTIRLWHHAVPIDGASPHLGLGRFAHSTFIASRPSVDNLLFVPDPLDQQVRGR
jgi:hypothetical protein